MPSVYEYATEWSVRELKKEYTKLRNQFQKQIGRLAKVDQSTRVQQFLPGGYKFQKTIKDIENLRGRQNWTEKAVKEDWAMRVSELKQLTQARSLSLSGRKLIRKEAIQTLRESGYSSITASNFDKFVSFMNFAKSQGVLDEYDSNQIAEAFNDWSSGGMIQDETLAGYIEEWQAASESIDLFD